MIIMDETRPTESTEKLQQDCNKIYSTVEALYVDYCNELVSRNLTMIEKKMLAPTEDVAAKSVVDLLNSCPKEYQYTPNITVQLPQKKIQKPKTVEVQGKYMELTRRTIYTPLNEMYAFDRKVDYIPYFGDNSVDVVTQVMAKHKEKIHRRWIMREYKNEYNTEKVEDVFLFFAFLHIGSITTETVQAFIDACRPEYSVEKLMKRVQELEFRYGKKAKYKCMSIMQGDITVESAMGTYVQLFCGICKKYDCLLHGIKSVDSLADYNVVQEEKYPNVVPAKPCDNNCYMSHSGSESLFQPSEIIESIPLSEETPKASEEQVSPLETSLLNKLYDMYQYQPCKIAAIMGGSKFNCKAVDKWIKKHKKQPEGAIGIFEKPRKPVMKRTSKRKIHKIQLYNILHMKQRVHYTECMHPNGESCKDANCSCIIRGFCEKYCLCSPSCPLRYSGCNCKAGSCSTGACPCYANKRECDEDLCENCRQPGKRCKNFEYSIANPKKTAVSLSTVCNGWGLFALENMKKGDYIGPYCGEVICDEEVDKRGEWDQYEKLFYLFSADDEYAIDAKYFGNKQRFINHSTDNPNCQPMLKFSQGLYRILFYATKDVRAGEELFFNYDETGKLAEHFDWAGDEKRSKERGKAKSKVKPFTARKKRRPTVDDYIVEEKAKRKDRKKKLIIDEDEKEASIVEEPRKIFSIQKVIQDPLKSGLPKRVSIQLEEDKKNYMNEQGENNENIAHKETKGDEYQSQKKIDRYLIKRII